jgi:FKBP-type peptidyl-prolyl cis-trans isomerase (trigger factor)
MINTQQAVMSLRPGVEWSMNGDDVEGIIWHTPDVEPLTTAEVEAEIKRLEKAEADKVKKDQEATAAAIAHAKSLGFTDQMISVMYPNLGA